MASCGERTLRISYLDPVRFAEPDNLADDGIGAVRRCEYGSHAFATGMDAACVAIANGPVNRPRSNDLFVESVTFARASSGDVCSRARSIPVDPIRSAAELRSWF